jgi:hypothetical protein
MDNGRKHKSFLKKETKQRKRQEKTKFAIYRFLLDLKSEKDGRASERAAECVFLCVFERNGGDGRWQNTRYEMDLISG